MRHQTNTLSDRRLRLLTALLAMFAVVAVVVAASPVFAQTAGTSVSVTPASQSAAVGDTITVNIGITSDQTLESVQMDVSYDTAVLQATGYTYGTDWNAAQIKLPTDPNAVVANGNADGTMDNIAAAFLTGPTLAPGTTAFVSITFNVVGAGSTGVTVSIDEMLGGAVAETQIDPGTITVNNATVTVAGAAAGTQFSVSPASQTVSNGDTFTVAVNIDSVEVLESAQIDVTFNQAVLQAVSYVYGTEWNAAPVKLPTNAAAVVTDGNADGTLDNIAAAFLTGPTVPAGDSQFVVITFQAIANGSSAITVNVDEVLGGAVAENVLTDVGTTGGSVTVSAGPTPTPVPATPTPVATPAPGQEDTLVTGTVQPGNLTLNAPGSIAFAVTQFNRDADNQISVSGLSVDADTPWELSVQDPKAAHTGHMINGDGEALINSMRVQSPGFQVVDLKIPGGGLLANGSGNGSGTNTPVPFNISQRVETEDQAGSYSLTLRFTLTGIF